MGFSTTTCLPAAATANPMSACSPLGVHTTTTSMSGRATNASRRPASASPWAWANRAERWGTMSLTATNSAPARPSKAWTKVSAITPQPTRPKRSGPAVPAGPAGPAGPVPSSSPKFRQPTAQQPGLGAQCLFRGRQLGVPFLLELERDPPVIAGPGQALEQLMNGDLALSDGHQLPLVLARQADGVFDLDQEQVVGQVLEDLGWALPPAVRVMGVVNGARSPAREVEDLGHNPGAGKVVMGL